MSKRVILLTLIAALLSISAAGIRETPSTVSIWGHVYFETGARPCSELPNYIEPCEGCRVWVRWPEPAPGHPIMPLRLDGYITDESGGCQVLNVSKYVTCHK